MSDLPPIEPRDLRSGRNRDTNPDYPPSGADYPPPDFQEPPPPPPQQPRQQPRRAAYPPPDYREEDRQQQAPPPRESYYQPAQPPPPERREPYREEPRRDDWDRGEPDYDRPRSRERELDQDFDRMLEADSERGRGGRPPRLDEFDAPDLRRRMPRVDELEDDSRDRASRLRERYDPQGQTLLSERQVEALGWGVMVILLGIGILLFFTGSSDFLTIGFPVLGGGVLLGSSVYQSMKHWRVSFLTWFTAIGLVSFSITRLIALADNQDTGFGTSLAFFFGVSIIITGVIVLIRIFR